MSERVVVTVAGLEPDLGLVDVLARLHLAAARLGWTLEIRGVSDELRGLLDLVGLTQLGPDLQG